MELKSVVLWAYVGLINQHRTAMMAMCAMELKSVVLWANVSLMNQHWTAMIKMTAMEKKPVIKLMVVKMGYQRSAMTDATAQRIHVLKVRVSLRISAKGMIVGSTPVVQQSRTSAPVGR